MQESASQVEPVPESAKSALTTYTTTAKQWLSSLLSYITPKAIEKCEPNHKLPKLTWADFPGKPREDLDYDAYCCWKFNYNYDEVVKDGGKVDVIMNARCDLDNEHTWVKPGHQSDRLLEHEQGHYYIGCLCALTFNKKMKEMTFDKETCEDEIKKMYDEVLKEFQDYEVQYDKETNHYYNQEEQKKWNKKLASEVEALQEYWWK